MKPLCSHCDWHWVFYGGVGGVVAVLVGYMLLDWDLLEGVSWKTVAFFVLYTVIICVCFGHQQTAVNNAEGSWKPSGLARLRSYLTFLPITHIIQHGDVKESVMQGLSDPQKNQQAGDNELSIRISTQKDFAIESILNEYVTPWHSKMSSNTVFTEQCKGMLLYAFQALGEKLQEVDRNEIAQEIIQTVHLHWKEYCDATCKSASTHEDIIKCFKFVHPYLQDQLQVSQRYEKLVETLLSQLEIPNLESPLLRQFLTGIITKSVVLYYVDQLCQPCWINSNLILLLSSQRLLTELAGCSSQTSSAPATPQRSPKPALGEGSSNVSTPTTNENSASIGGTPPQRHLESTAQREAQTRFLFSKKEIQQLRITEDKSSGDASAIKTSLSASNSVSSALGGVFSTTTLPIVPSIINIMDLDHGFPVSSAALKKDETDLSHPTDAEILSQCVTTDNSKVDAESTSAIFKHEHPDPSAKPSVIASTIGKGATIPAHYHSFEEVSQRKTNHHLLETGTLSVDEALENMKRKLELQKSKDADPNISTDKEGDVKTIRSPVYEEPEDFATSIAKLRNLLEQKQSRQTLHSKFLEDKQKKQNLQSECKKQGVSDDEQQSITNASNDTNQQPGSDWESSDADEESEPELKCYFLNINIPKVEYYNNSSSQYDFYCIQYEGVYFDEKDVDEHMPPKIILRTTTVRRRFKEFLLLQSKLEEKAEWKPYLKGIKTPNRWLNLSFSKTDAVSTRKCMLERYLNQICTHPALGTSAEVLQFMAYGDAGFNLDPMDIDYPKHLLSNKLDKLAKKFTGVINSLKDVLPSFDSNQSSPHSELGGTEGLHASGEPMFCFTTNESEEVGRVEDNKAEELHSVSEQGKAKIETTQEQENDLPVSNITVQILDASPNAEFAEDSYSYTAYPLASALTQLLCDILWLPNCRPHNASVSTFMSLSGKALENYVHEFCEVFVSDEAILGYLEWFNKFIVTEAEPIGELSTELDIQNCLRKRIPAWVRWMWGKNRLDVTIERITGFFQNPIINHDLALSLCELLLSKITGPVPQTE